MASVIMIALLLLPPMLSLVRIALRSEGAWPLLVPALGMGVLLVVMWRGVYRASGGALTAHAWAYGSAYAGLIFAFYALFIVTTGYAPSKYAFRRVPRTDSIFDFALAAAYGAAAGGILLWDKRRSAK